MRKDLEEREREMTQEGLEEGMEWGKCCDFILIKTYMCVANVYGSCICVYMCMEAKG